MLTYYYSRNSSALAAHILLEDAGADYTAVEVSIARGEHLSAEALRRNPKGRIPVLETPEGTITENPAILEYIADIHPAAALKPEGAFELAKARSLCAYLCATAHVAFAHRHRGARWADTEAAHKDMQSKVASNLKDYAAVLEAHLPPGPWAMGEAYSFCDPYLFLFHRWMDAAGADRSACPRLCAHDVAMKERPSVQRVLQLHAGDTR